ncbi:hypothetical protein Sjap_024377 [Stephania japonica]|uniref:DDT domain-containing protein n=1 Tax=Stephania japonica TaxID=461633 RepID=A0AAP0HQ30_9MAGN
MVASSSSSSTRIEIATRVIPVRRSSPSPMEEASQKVNDGENEPKQGKTCHQCRQKAKNAFSLCKNQRNGKPCPIKFCQKCLLNRYGEKVEEVAVIIDWVCPKCRGICNCSCCMKKKGHQPTGMLAPTAKATGFSSVSEMLLAKGPVGLSAVKQVGSSTKKRGKENSFDGNLNSNLISSSCDKDAEELKVKSTKGGGTESCTVGEENTKGNELKKSYKKSRISEEITKKAVKKEGKTVKDDGSTFVTDSPCKSQTHRNIPPNFNRKDANVCANNARGSLVEGDSHKLVSRVLSDDATAPPSEISKDEKAEPAGLQEFRKTEKCRRMQPPPHIELPKGIELTNVAGIELASEDAGHALQFLEFCKAFGQIFNVKKGQSELILRELVHQRSRRRGQYSPIVQFHIQLLSLLQEDSGEKPLPLSATGNGWLQALGKWISASQGAFGDLPSNCFDRGGDGYEDLSVSQKLRILNFLCDEALGTTELRTWIDEQDLKLARRTKEAKEKIVAAKDKEKQVRQQLQDEMARAACLSISEYDEVMSKMRSEAEKVRTEIHEAILLLPKKKQRPDAVRTVPVFLDGHGHVFWRLRGTFCEASILVQDIETRDSATPKEKWYIYDGEQNKVVEKYISLSKNMLRMQKLSDKFAFGTCKASLKDDTLDDLSPSSGVEES